jgi:hypothetical protein
MTARRSTRPAVRSVQTNEEGTSIESMFFLFACVVVCPFVAIFALVRALRLADHCKLYLTSVNFGLCMCGVTLIDRSNVSAATACRSALANQQNTIVNRTYIENTIVFKMQSPDLLLLLRADGARDLIVAERVRVNMIGHLSPLVASERESTQTRQCHAAPCIARAGS